MDSRLFEDALALIEERNLSRAAARRNVTQPAFSRRIRALEDWLGVELLDRRANSVALKPGLVDNAAGFRALLDRIEQFRERVSAATPSTRTMVLATQHALSAMVIPSILRHVAASRPEITWNLRTVDREDCIALFFRGDADILLCYEARGFPPLPFASTIVKRTLMRDSLVPLIGGAHRYALDADGTLPDSVPILAYPTYSHFGRLLEETRIEESLNRKSRHILAVSAFTLGMPQMIREGLGLGWLPLRMVKDDLASGTLVSLHETFGSIPLDVTLVVARDNAAAVGLVETLEFKRPGFAGG
jgi:DNA-binding transcriptional LysR family regulator